MPKSEKRQGHFVVPLSVVDLPNKLFLEFGCFVEELAEQSVESVDLIALECDVLEHFLGYCESLILERFTCGGDLNVENSLVLLGAAADDIALCLESLENGSECTRIKIELFSELLYVLGLFLPEYHHNDVLCIGKSELIKMRTISFDHFARSGIEREAELTAKAERLVFVFHFEPPMTVDLCCRYYSTNH